MIVHSLRKNVVEALERARVHQSEVAQLVGHGRGFTFSVYSPRGLDLKGLREVVEKHARHKIVTVHLRDGQPKLDVPRELAATAEVIEHDGQTLKVRVERKEVARASFLILRDFDVVDLAIEEPDIGSVIENIMRTRAGA